MQLSNSSNPMQIQVPVIPTICVKVFLNNLFVGLFRIMGDSGSEQNLVQIKILKQLRIKPTPVNGCVTGITDPSLAIRKSIKMEIQPWYENDKNNRISFSFWVLPKASKWAPIFPNQILPCDVLCKPLEAPLADPFFWQAGEVPILLGTESYAKIVEGMCVKVSNGLNMQQSSMGNIIYGSASNAIQEDSIEFAMNKRICAVDLQELEQNLQRFWHFEDLSLCTRKSAEDDLAEQILIIIESQLVNTW